MKDIKPIENDESWSAYFACCDQLRKGTTTMKKGSASKAPARKSKVQKRKPKAAPSSSPVKGKKSRRMSKLQPIAEFHMEEGDEENVSENVSSSLKRGTDEIQFQSSPDMGVAKRRRGY